MPGDGRSALMTGGCQCGAVRYALYARPVASLCHCRMCQRAVGGPFAALAMVAPDDFAWTSGAPRLFPSSSVAERGFCAVCGTPLTYQGLSGSTIDVTICSLDDPEAAPPYEQVGMESRVTWLALLPTLPASDTDAKYAGLISHQHAGA